ncbi:FHA domain protein [Pseudobythopirellula maris]|uniref:FHA domain protein n=1 Tax=Pseudobythopirellula maris TaxID=2527991 RepID=A0A5C5ZU36_9BACT|nr:FHA domain-containing protein [Pseudobythopirellula maris]TWT90528.1 FHA domain protein [Pseudobythopirellula maris]
MYGELIPLGGGDPIPLLKKRLLIGRRESCDIVLRFANVSAHHCQLSIDGGYLYARDLQSRNGIKINDVRTTDGRLDPGDVLCVSKHKYKVYYSPAELGAVGPPPTENRAKEIMSESLLARAGLQSATPKDKASAKAAAGRYDPANMEAGQVKLPDEAL